MHLAQPKQSVV